MKKYILKFNNGTELIILKKTDILYDILMYVNVEVKPWDISKLSVWMDGKVLD